MLIILFLLINTASGDDKPLLTLVDYVDYIELNHFYDEQGRLVFDQVIMREWNPYSLHNDVVAWRLVKDGRYKSSPEMIRAWMDKELERVKNKPEKAFPFVDQWVGSPMIPTLENGMYVSRYVDTSGFIRKIICKYPPTETWTQFDPELIEREYLPKERRIELMNFPVIEKK